MKQNGAPGTPGVQHLSQVPQDMMKVVINLAVQPTAQEPTPMALHGQRLPMTKHMHFRSGDGAPPQKNWGRETGDDEKPSDPISVAGAVSPGPLRRSPLPRSALQLPKQTASWRLQGNPRTTKPVIPSGAPCAEESPVSPPPSPPVVCRCLLTPLSATKFGARLSISI